MNYLFYCLCEKTRLLTYQIHLESKLSALPEGRFCIHRNGRDKPRWRIKLNGKWRSLPKSKKDLALDLIRRAYYENELSRTRKRIILLDSLISEYSDLSTQNMLPEYGTLLAEALENTDPELLKWAASPYDACPDYPERKNVETKSGVFVRSKSEAAIADALFEHGIPFHYEEALRLGPAVIYPDFTIRSPLAPEKRIIWDHFGMMDKAAYLSTVQKKLTSYLDFGYIPMDNLIMTFETKDKPLNINTVLMMISACILQG